MVQQLNFAVKNLQIKAFSRENLKSVHINESPCLSQLAISLFPVYAPDLSSQVLLQYHTCMPAVILPRTVPVRRSILKLQNFTLDFKIELCFFKGRKMNSKIVAYNKSPSLLFKKK